MKFTSVDRILIRSRPDVAAAANKLP